jgi:hypothetical protein
MGNRDRPKKQPKRKAKEKTHKAAPPSPVVYEPTTVEVIKPKRKPRDEPDAG